MIDNLLLMAIGILIGVAISVGVVNVKWEHHNTIVKQDCGQYNSKTGQFEWLKK